MGGAAVRRVVVGGCEDGVGEELADVVEEGGGYDGVGRAWEGADEREKNDLDGWCGGFGFRHKVAYRPQQRGLRIADCALIGRWTRQCSHLGCGRKGG